MIDSFEPLIKKLLHSVGEDPEREDLKKTPERFLAAFWELTAGYRTDKDSLVEGALHPAPSGGLVAIEDIDFYSLCEHHLIPFFGKATVSYYPDKEIIGIGRVPKIINFCSAKLQVQERLTEEIHDILASLLKPKGLQVTLKGQHLCSMMLGGRPNFFLITTRSSGCLEKN
jgi:GTP cyclohydrolase IA